jgi:hypothetical protein
VGLRHKPAHQITNFFDLLDSVIVPQVARQALSDWIEAKISAPIALVARMNVFQQPEAVRVWNLFSTKCALLAIRTSERRRLK